MPPLGIYLAEYLAPSFGDGESFLREMHARVTNFFEEFS